MDGYDERRDGRVMACEKPDPQEVEYANLNYEIRHFYMKEFIIHQPSFTNEEARKLSKVLTEAWFRDKLRRLRKKKKSAPSPTI